MNQKEIPADELADVIGIRKDRVDAWITGSSSLPPRPVAIAIADYFNCDLNWLILGKKCP